MRTRAPKRLFQHVYDVYERLRRKLALASPATVELDRGDTEALGQIQRVLMSPRIRRRINRVYGIEAHLLNDGRVAGSWANRGFEVPDDLLYHGPLAA